jgi:hypothetical protein
MIDQYPSPNGVLTSLIWRKTAAGGETSLSGYDNANQALSYTPGQEQVYLNGILLVRGEDYTATNGTSITGLTALAASDFIQINCYNNFSVASVPSTSITGNITSSQVDSSIVTTTGTQTLTNKTLTSPTITSASGVINNTLTTTTGDIIYASGANTPARLGIGSTGQVLSVSGGVPSWTTLSSGGMTLLSTTSLSGQSTVTVSGIDQGYTNLYIFLKNFYAASGSTIAFRLNGNTTGYNYTYTEHTFGSIASYGVQSGIIVNNAQVFPGTGSYVDGPASFNTSLIVYDYSRASSMKTFHWFGGGIWNPSTNWTAFNGGGTTMFNNAVTSVSAVMSSNFSTGTMYIYGAK